MNFEGVGGVPGVPASPSVQRRSASGTFAAALCFVAAIGGVLGCVWGFVAKALVNDSVADVRDSLTDDAAAAIGRLGMLNVITAVVSALIAVGFVIGGAALLRRRPWARTVVAVTCAVQVVGVIAVYVAGIRAWDRIDTATADLGTVEAVDVGAGIVPVIARCVMAVVIVILVFWPVLRRDSDALPLGVGNASGGTAVAAAVLSLVGGVLFAVVAVVLYATASTATETRIAGGVLAGLGAIAAGLIVGGTLLLRRRYAGAVVVITAWLVVILFAAGFVFAVVHVSSRPARAFARTALVSGPVIAVGAVTVGLALAASSARWCDSRLSRAQAVATGAPAVAAAEAHGLQSAPDRPLTSAAPPSPAPTVPSNGRPWWRRVWVIASGAAALVAVLVVAGVVAITASPRTAEAPARVGKVHTFGEQVALPFPDETANYVYAQAIAVNRSGTVYVSYIDVGSRGRQGLKPPIIRSLTPGAGAAVQLPTVGLSVSAHGSLAVDDADTVYVGGRRRGSPQDCIAAVRKGSSSPSYLPFGRDECEPNGIAVDDERTVYIATTHGVLSLRTGATAPTRLPFEDGEIAHVAVGADGTVYARYDNKQGNRVVALPRGATKPVALPFSGLGADYPTGGIAVDHEGTVYVADSSNARVLALPAGGTSQVALPITGRTLYPQGVAVDGGGNVYIYGSFGAFYVKLPVTD
ncbi:NHL repeat-containing protein [Tsukamurella tyrosinosolvens]|uniref:hypothetical protein n=1 Tax=Tsukamurella tyrosinosolvens TaxID=57704 RepID=UPI002DD421C1|nr:hypothetical protein [Tsukamurella tyrosinosolvens]MEC4615713.1 hypothetical protein [Tsukamurella tyrosinosolvens]